MTNILCLHGGGGNGDALRTQLAPIINELAKTTEIHFHFLNGPVPARPALGFAERFEGPFHRFLDKDAPFITPRVEQIMSPQAIGCFMRETGLASVNSSTACDFVEKHLDQHREIPYHGVFGMCEGASVAASLMLRQKSQGKPWPFQFAIFVSAIPPFRWDENDVLLPNETRERILIPTSHISGVEDPGRQAGKILYDLCEESSAALSYHKGGHTIPWDRQSTLVIGEAIRRVIRQSQGASIGH